MKEDFEVLEYEEFLRVGKKQIAGLREKYLLTKDKEYLNSIKKVKNILRIGVKLKDYCVFNISEYSELGFTEFSDKEETKEFYKDALKERLYNFV
jgi:hypothetical protein